MAKSMQVLKMVYHGVYTVQFYTTPNITNPYKIYSTIKVKGQKISKK